MDSLLANYASSDEEDNNQEKPPPPPRTQPAKSQSEARVEREKDFFPPNRGGIFNSLPPPKSSLFGTLPPPPKSQSLAEPQAGFEQIVGDSKPNKSSSLFSKLPPPKLSSSSSSTSSASKRVVQFRPPTIANPSFDDEDDDDDEQERQRKKPKDAISTSSSASFLSSIPAPRHSNTLGALPSGSGTSRRSMLETDVPDSSGIVVSEAGNDEVVNPNVDQSNEMNNGYSAWGSESENHAYYSGNDAVPNGNENCVHPSSLGGESYAYYGAYGVGSTDVSSVSTAGNDAGVNYNAGSYETGDYSYGDGQHVEYTNYGGSYDNYSSNSQYEKNSAYWTAFPEVSGVVENVLKVPGRKGRKDVPPEIVEVKQDELMKNRPREDQVKMTGIAFGPSYQPASTKGKPTKLHKRKHQIGALYFDMRQKEMELAERRSKGLLTKAQTQAKYGW